MFIMHFAMWNYNFFYFSLFPQFLQWVINDTCFGRLEGDGENQRAVQTEETETLECGLVLRSIGYKGIPIDSSLPFDQRTGTIANNNGRVKGQNGVYVSGWIGTGPVGVILSTMTSGFTSGKMLVADINSGQVDVSSARGGKEEVLDILSEKGL